MKIVQVVAVDVTLETLLKPLIKATQNKGIETHCVSNKGPYYNELIDNDFYFHEVKIDRKISPINNLKSIISLVKLFRNIKPTIVHVHTPVASVLGRIAAKIAKVPVIIYTAHGFYFHEGMSNKQYNFFYKIEKYVGKFCTDYIFTQSEEDFEVAKSGKFLSKKNSDNFVHISNGIDITNKFNYSKFKKQSNINLRKKYGLSEDDLVVTFIGRLVKEKGILDFLDSYKFLQTKNVKFIVIGGLPEGERDTETVNKLEKYKANKNIIFTGHIKNINEHLFMSDVFCLPSYREGMPRSIIEGMAMKNAILATNIRGSREEVLHGKNGYLFDINDSQAIAKYIDILSNNPELLNDYKKFSFERAHSIYNEEFVIKKQLQIFNKYK
ncbi:glycosyltransferase family 4 protein [Mammaliicoccus sciuri]|uniref:glycosyltransferase family 4 protein n=1 Tax=Mammaliicoccus sciuri TaxID=1296 RepID=UPI0019503E6B|nr:glycosyltransferase family 4 protein [Mammaliicoccus sciuri]